MSNENKKIYLALSKINAAIEPIKKEKTNSAQGYKFRGIDDFYNMLQKLFAEHKVMCIPRVIQRSVSSYDNAKGTKTFKVEQEMMFKLLSLEDGSFEEIGPLWGEALDTSDKATNKSNSAAAKYALMMSFMVPTEDMVDGDSDHNEISYLSNYQIQYSKSQNHGKKLGEISLDQLQKYHDYLTKWQTDQGKALTHGPAKDLEAITNYLKEQK